MDAVDAEIAIRGLVEKGLIEVHYVDGERQLRLTKLGVELEKYMLKKERDKRLH